MNQMWNIIRSLRYSGKKLFYERRDGGAIYRHGNSVIKAFNVECPRYRNEFETLELLSRPDIVRVTDSYYECNQFHVVMPYYPLGDVFSLISPTDQRNCDDIHLLHACSDLLRPVVHLHENSMVHLDLKLENYLRRCGTGGYVLIDFELARRYSSHYHSLDKMDMVCGTDTYMAPEVQECRYGPTSDVYSLGCLMYLFIARQVPDHKEMDWSSVNAIDPALPPLIGSMLHNDYLRRPSVFRAYSQINSIIDKRACELNSGEFSM